MPHRLTRCDVWRPPCLLAGLLWPASAGAAERWKPDVAGAAAWASARQGSVTFAVRTEDRLVGRGLDRQVPSASVIKAMLMVTYLRQASVRDRPLDATDKALLSPMIRRSDNIAATRVRDIVGNAAIVRLAQRAGMTRFVIHPHWGLSLITARDQTRFFLDIESLLPDLHRAYALRLLRTIVPSQRWGMAQVIPAAGSCTSRAAGDPAPAPSTTRSACWCAASTASRSPC